MIAVLMNIQECSPILFGTLEALFDPTIKEEWSLRTHVWSTGSICQTAQHFYCQHKWLLDRFGCWLKEIQPTMLVVCPPPFYVGPFLPIAHNEWGGIDSANVTIIIITLSHNHQENGEEK